ncbi:hypothetical protein Pcinc_018983 [Petrolisthes cinctipes]|uniref:CUB domain-containing protein n=1 Tax=Petrolisthes cinctipes TaxID=88211 RepID=A0AAE1KLS1_PETCI|nr:hypothetical protein Pcinc_018983 [Petrolisthes cinctipes]
MHGFWWSVLVVGVVLVVGTAADGEERVTSLPCGTHTMLPGQRLTLQTPNFPSNYDENYRCQWEITCTTMETTTLRIACPSFQLESSTNCDADRLIVADHEARVVYCGTNSPSNRITINGWARFTFWSNLVEGTTARGFRCFVWCDDITTTSTTLTTTTSTTTEEECVCP